jgi:quinol monooxygenase YgiN
MSEPIVFISHNRVKDGKLDEFREFYRESVKAIKAEKPGTLLHLAFVNEEGSEVTIVHLFTDAEAMDLHMLGAAERVELSSEFIESKSLEIYGMPNEGLLEMLGKLVGSGVGLSLTPENVGGYVRLKSG